MNSPKNLNKKKDSGMKGKKDMQSVE